MDKIKNEKMKFEILFKNRKWWLMIDQAFFSGISLITTILLTRVLDIKSFGLFSGNVLMLYLVLSILSALVTQPFQVNLPTVKSRAIYQSFCFLLYSILIILFIIVMLIVRNYFSFSTYILLYSVGFLYHDFWRRILLAIDLIEQTTFLDFIYAVFQMSLVVYIYYNTISNLSSVLCLLSIGYIPPLVLGLSILKPFKVDFLQYKLFLKLHYSQGKWLTATSVIQWWSSNQFVLYSSLYLGLEALGALRLVQTIFGVFNLVLQSFENYFLPQSALRLVQGKQQSIQYIHQLMQYSFPIVAVVLILMFIYADDLIYIIGGEKFSAYSFLIKGFALLYVLIWIAQPIRIAIRILLLNQSFFIGYLISLILSLLFSNYLLREYQLYGTVIGLIGLQLVLILFWHFTLVKNKFNLCKLSI